jgi:hypothetical protein
MKRWFFLIAVSVAGTAAANVITLDMASLPSDQGWEYNTSGVHAGTAEADIVSTDGTTLRVDTMGEPAETIPSNATYRRTDVVGDAPLTILEWTSRTLDHEGLSDGYIAFFAGFRINTRDCAVGIMPDQIMVRNGAGVTLIDMDATTYRTYRIEAAAGSSTYDFYIDGELQTSPSCRISSEFYSVVFGDGTGKANARTDITALEFSQIPEPASVVLIGLVSGCTLFVRRWFFV